MGLFDGRSFNIGGFMDPSPGKNPLDKFLPSNPKLVDPGARPEWQDPTNLLDAQGLIKQQYRVPASALSDINKEALEELRRRSKAVGPTEQAKYLQEAQALDELQGLGKAQAGSRQATSDLFSKLASTGGLSGGARERMAEQGRRGLASSMQDVRAQGMQNRLSILANDEAQKLGILSTLPGMEVQAWQPEFQKAQYQSDIDRFNVGNSLAEVGRQDNARLSKYQEQMRAYAAAQQANAIAESNRPRGGGKK